MISVTGRWIAHQSNGFDVHFALEQDPLRNTVAGTATYTPGDVPSKPKEQDGVKGEVTEVIGDHFHVVVSWSDGKQGDYHGILSPDGILRGTHLRSN